MKFRGLLVGLVVLVALAALLYWSNHESSAKRMEAASSATNSPKILALNQADIIKIEIKKKASDDVILSKKESGAWQITTPKDYSADSGAVSSLLSTVSSLSSERVVDEKAGDLSPYGLASPAAELVVTESGNKSQRLLIGDNTPSGSAVYAALAGDPRIFTIATYEKTNLDKSLNDFRDKRFLTIDSDKINRLETSAKKSQLEFDRYKDRWQIVKPKPMRADSSPIEAFISSLAAAKIELNQPAGDRDKIARSFANAEAVGTVKVMSDTGTQELIIRKIGKDYYAKSSVLDAPYKISTEIGQQLAKPLDDFRNKKLFDFGYSDPAKIELHDGAKSVFLTRSGSDWWGPDGKKLELAPAYSLLDKLRGLKADKFVESGFGAPEIEITVTPGNETQVERVALSKSGAAYIGKRETDPTLYQVDAKAVEELKHAALEMKPARR